MHFRRWINIAIVSVLVASTFVAFQNYTAYNPEEALHVEVGYRRLAKVIAQARVDEIEKFSKDMYDGCEQAGQLGDKRDIEKAYFCREYPFGVTDIGIPSKFENKDFITSTANSVAVLAEKECKAFWQSKKNNSNLNEDFEIPGLNEEFSCSAFPLVNKSANKIDRAKLVVKLTALYKNARKSSDEWGIYKTLTRTTVEYKDKKKTRALNIHVKMSRRQNESEYQVKDLNTLKLEAFDLSNDWRGRQRVQIVPHDNNLYINACTYNPGFKIDIPAFDGKYTYADGWWGSASVKFSADPGGMSFKHLEVCGLVKVSMPEGAKDQSLQNIASNVKVELIALEPPKIIGATFEKPKYKIKSALVKFLIKIADLVGLGVTKKINATIAKNYAQYVPTPEELRNGTWLKKVPARLLDKRIKTNYKSMIASLAGSGGIENKIVYNAVDVLQQTCAKATQSLSHQILRKLALKQCQNVLTDSDLTVTPFIRNKSSASRGCYANSFDANDGLNDKSLNGKSWAVYTNQAWAGLGTTDDGCRLTGLGLKGKFSQEMGNLLKCHVTYVNFKQNIAGYKMPAKACELEAKLFVLSLLRLDSWSSETYAERLEALKNRVTQLLAKNYALAQRVSASLNTFINEFRQVVTVQDFDEVVTVALEQSDLVNVGQELLQESPEIKRELTKLKSDFAMPEEQILSMLIIAQALKH